MNVEVRTKFFDKIEDKYIPYGLTLRKIFDRGEDFKEVEGKFEFIIVRHPTMLSSGEGRASGARWHNKTKYCYDPVEDE